ncbi:MAG: universal stress protein [Candidatus Acidiferrales bacterium]|jgi:nucleotide-binding universal stress UspA family protein
MLPPKLIMSPIDFSDHSDVALKTATDMGSRLGAELLLVHVVPAIPRLPSATAFFHEGEYEEELHKCAQKRLDEMVRALEARGIKARAEIGTANDVSMELLRIAEHNNVDLIAIATHGMTGWHKLAFGSVTDKVVRLAACPVLVLRAQPQGQSQDTLKADPVAAAR